MRIEHVRIAIAMFLVIVLKQVGVSQETQLGTNELTRVGEKSPTNGLD